MDKLEIIDQIEITEFEIKRLKSLGANWTTTINKTIKELENKLDQLKKELFDLEQKASHSSSFTTRRNY